MRFLTAGESHGKALSLIIEGLPAGIELTAEEINKRLQRRQGGYGRGGRMKIEKDKAEILSGVRDGKTLGSPLAIMIENKDWENWQRIMAVEAAETEEKAVYRPRPGHADLPGALKYRQEDVRNILERASARETTTRVAIGAVAGAFLSHFSVESGLRVMQVGRVKAKENPEWPGEDIYQSPLYCQDSEAEQEMIQAIDEAREKGDTLGGVFEIRVRNLPPGLGSHVHWERKLDGLLAQAVMSIPGIKAVEIGAGLRFAEEWGSELHDQIAYSKERGYYHCSNNSGGIEGGISNGEELWLRAVMKPIPTLYTPLASVDFRTKDKSLAAVERSDISVVPAAAVVAEAMVLWVLAEEWAVKFGGDHLEEIRKNFENYLDYLQGR